MALALWGRSNEICDWTVLTQARALSAQKKGRIPEKIFFQLELSSVRLEDDIILEEK
jgi:hypothetical protein